jgi:gas vesicle protein
MSEEAPGRQTRVLDKQRLRTFLLGGAAGILAGIFLAPRSGRELRGSIMERAGEARERGRETLFEAQERMQERLAEAREGSSQRAAESSDSRAEDLTPDAPPRLRDVSRDVEESEPAEVSEDLREKVRETRARLREKLDGKDGDLRPGR